MKKTLLIAMILIAGIPAILNAHAPKKIISEYNSESGILKLKVIHPVKDVNNHFIDDIIITINGKESEFKYTKQDSEESRNAEIEFKGLEKGTIIGIYAECNKFGSKKSELVVE